MLLDRSNLIFLRLLEVSDTMHRNILDVLLRAALHQAQIIVGQTENGTRNRRRPLQGPSATDELSERKICTGEHMYIFHCLRFVHAKSMVEFGGL